MNILVVENGSKAAQCTSAVLCNNHFTTTIATTGKRGLKLAGLHHYDGVVLQLELPDLSGYEVLHNLRQAEITAPVLALSNLDQPQAIVRALNAGADGVLTVPFDGDELVARAQVMIRRSRRSAQPSITVGPLTLNAVSRNVAVHGAPVHLTAKEFAVLEMLTQRRGSTISKESILSQLYNGRDEPEIKIIDVFICKLRKKLAECGAEDLITTIWGRGYMVRGDGELAAGMGTMAAPGRLSDATI